MQIRRGKWRGIKIGGEPARETISDGDGVGTEEGTYFSSYIEIFPWSTRAGREMGKERE